MIRHTQPEVFSVFTSVDHVEVAADNARVPVVVVGGVPCAIGVLRYAAPVSVAEQVA